MGNVQAVIDLPEELYLSLSASGLTKEKIANESRNLPGSRKGLLRTKDR